MRNLIKTLVALIIVASLSLNVYYVVKQPSIQQITTEVIKTLVKRQHLNQVIIQLDALDQLEKSEQQKEDTARINSQS